MKDSRTVKKPRGKGRPFVKGDPRINRIGGNLGAEVLSYEITWRNAMARGLSPEEYADICIEDVRRHRPGAREFYAKWVMGEGKDKLEHSGVVSVQFIMPRPAEKK